MVLLSKLISYFTLKKKVIVICGPTATGKTSLSIMLAKKFNAEVISADSRQIYKGLDIGTAKVTEEEKEGVPHHMLDIAGPQDIYSVQEYVQEATKIIRQLHKENKIPIICGGSGMYIDSLVCGTQFPKVPPNYALRKELEKKSTDELYSLLKQQDPRRAKTIDPDNPVRLVRALEVINAIGVVPKIKKQSEYKTLYIGLDLPKEQLNERIKKRIVERFENEGMLQEAIDLHTNGLNYERMEQLGLEYRYMARYLEKKISYDEMIEQLTTKTIQFAKRQRTWFKRNKNIQWFDPQKDSSQIVKLTKKFFK
ncbi:MAG: tRNA (adenosine(37)-N6)-dimethylallyltransferase MiaA [Candidatus Pacebacteria bacterium]|nr:tRNA (adenosine(37)-N6)-dimethylallyltransferase MiaA [Candidatus Paceibacterota bacterium]